jgi:anti-anti-sigma factor
LVAQGGTGLVQSAVMGDSTEPLREPPVRGVEQRNGAVVVRLGGELDLYNADEIRHALTGAIAGGAPRIVVDMSNVDFVDSTALGVLVEARSKLGPDGLLLAGPQLETRRTLEVSGLDRHLPVHDSVDGALAASGS